MSTTEQPSKTISQDWFTRVGETGETTYNRDPNAAGVNVVAIYEEVVFDADDEIDLTQLMPAGSKMLAYVINPKTAFAFTTATHLALGDTSDVDHFFEVAKTNFDAKNEQYKAWLTTPVAKTADTTLRLTTTNGSQTKAGSASGTIQVWILFETLPTIEAAS
jgi:hypothetical protein